MIEMVFALLLIVDHKIVEHMSGLIESMDEELKGMRNNKINIDFLKEQVSKLQVDVEKLIRNGNGEH